jgi:uncharacterized membrane protein
VFRVAFANRVVEPFSELGILGPAMKIGDYPKVLDADQDLNLNLYVGNHEGRVMYYRVLAKLGTREMNVSDEKPFDGVIIASYEMVLMDGFNVTMPIILKLNETGTNLRLVFEMHRFDPEIGAWTYHYRWNQLWLNVTKTN